MMNAEQLLRKLGATGKLKGFFYAIYMIGLVEQEPTATTLITKRLYPDTARHFHCSPNAVERDLRTVIQVCWKHQDREFWTEVAGALPSHRPTSSEFLDMAAAYLRQQSQYQPFPAYPQE